MEQRLAADRYRWCQRPLLSSRKLALRRAGQRFMPRPRDFATKSRCYLSSAPEARARATQAESVPVLRVGSHLLSRAPRPRLRLRLWLRVGPSRTRSACRRPGRNFNLKAAAAAEEQKLESRARRDESLVRA
eukprot:2933158-Rhodomonas_salina.1